MSMKVRVDDDERWPTLVVKEPNPKSEYEVSTSVEVPDHLVHDYKLANRQLAQAERAIMTHLINTEQVEKKYVLPQYLA